MWLRSICSIRALRTYPFSTLNKHKMRTKYTNYQKSVEEKKEQRIEGQKVSIPQFSQWGLSKEVVNKLEQLEIRSPSSIQQMSMKELLEREGGRQSKGVYLAAQTGTGKTLAFLLPVLQQMKRREEATGQRLTLPNRPQCIILVPSKELVEQTYRVLQQLTHTLRFTSVKCGHSLTQQQEINTIQQGVDIVVTTLDRLQRLRDKKVIMISHLQYLVIDEADTFLDSGYMDQLHSLSKQVIDRHPIQQVVFVGATYTGPLNRFFTQLFGKDQLGLKKLIEKDTHYNLHNITHEFLHLQSLDKHTPCIELLHKLKVKNNQQAVIFCNSISSVQALEHKIKSTGIDCVSLHGDTVKQFRLQNHSRFQQQQVPLLISTDLASRGLDFPKLPYVINLDFPRTSSDYLHRAGRTGRAQQQGTVFSFYHHKDQPLIKELQASHNHNRPLEIKHSAYNKINKEVLKNKNKSSSQPIPDYVYETSKSLLPSSYVDFKKSHDQALAKKAQNNYIPPRDRNQIQLKLLAKQRNKIKKHQRGKLGKNIRGIKHLEKKIRRKIYFEKPENKDKSIRNKKQKK